MLKDFKENTNKRNWRYKRESNGIFGAEKYILWNKNLLNEINSILH